MLLTGVALYTTKPGQPTLGSLGLLTHSTICCSLPVHDNNNNNKNPGQPTLGSLGLLTRSTICCSLPVHDKQTKPQVSPPCSLGLLTPSSVYCSLPVHDKKTTPGQPALFSGSSDTRCSLLQPTCTRQQQKHQVSPPCSLGLLTPGAVYCSLPVHDNNKNTRSARPVLWVF